MATLAITNDEVYSALGQLLGLGRSQSSWDPVTQADVDRIIRSGRRRFFSAHRWKFLESDFIRTTAAPFSDGTIEVVDGLVTLSGASRPSDIEDFMLVPDTGGVYEVSGAGANADEIQLHDTSLNLDAGSEYKLYRVHMTLPANFASWVGPVTTENSRDVRETRNFPEYTLRSVGSIIRPRTGRPAMFTVVSSVDEESGTPSYKLKFHPLPDKEYVISSRIRIQPGDTLDMASDVPNTHTVFSEAMMACILSAAEIIAFDSPGTHSQRLMELLPEAVAIDNRMAGVRQLPSRRRAAPNRLRELIDAPVIIEE
jgi:hypothetical protein